MIVDPWGKVLAELTGEGDKAEIAIADVDLDFVEKVRREVPLLRRT
jgi:predicted amidohydrolase